MTKQEFKALETVCKKNWRALAKLSKLENRQFYDKVSSFIGGIIGGIVAVIGKWAFWK